MRYLGNKTRMLKNIESFIKENHIHGDSFCDLFTGSASVADHFKDKYRIIANDNLVSSSIFAEAKIHNSKIPAFTAFHKHFKTDPFSYFSNKDYKKSDDHFIWKNYSPAGGRHFFTEEVANKIDGIRIELSDLLKENILDKNEFNFLLASLLETTMGLSNTTGTYEAFLKEWDSRSFKVFKLQPLEMETKELFSKKNIAYNEDANALIKKISGDILYLDTPYTITDYSSAYHILETISKYDNPVIRGITGRRVNKIEKSKYSIKNKVYEAYEDLIKNADFANIIISYSTQSLLPVDELIVMLKKYAIGDVVVKYYPFREYKNIRSSKKAPNLKEVLIYFRKQDGVIKSPLNYSGSKNYIVDQIIEQLPDNMSTFIDAMGGAFNVGVNIPGIREVVYNEYNPFVFGIVKYLLEEDKESIIANVTGLINKFNLSKSDKEAYVLYRDYYNHNKTPLNLFVLQMYCFQNQLRFNSKHDFNTPVGNCGCNETTFERIKSFIPKADHFSTTNLDFGDIPYKKYPKDSVFYFDPPYIITNATYNDGKRGFNGWDKEQEKRLLSFLDLISLNGQKFILSNVIFHNGKTNVTLQEWVNKNGYKMIELKPHSGRYGTRKEVLVKNY